MRTKTLVKNAIVVVDATPFRQWYESHYLLPLGRKKGAKLVSNIGINHYHWSRCSNIMLLYALGVFWSFASMPSHILMNEVWMKIHFLIYNYDVDCILLIQMMIVACQMIIIIMIIARTEVHHMIWWSQMPKPALSFLRLDLFVSRRRQKMPSLIRNAARRQPRSM